MSDTNDTNDPARRPGVTSELGAMRVTGVVIAAGASRRLGEPKQLLEFRGATLLDASLDSARQANLDQRIVTLGAAATEIQQRVDTTGFHIMLGDGPGDGCSASMVGAIAMVDGDSDGIVMLLGDQPDIAPEAIAAVIGAGASSPIAVCRYRDGIGHPFWFRRDVFEDLSSLHGDKAVWKLIESGRYPVTEVSIDTEVPLDVDTPEDYQRLLAKT